MPCLGDVLKVCITISHICLLIIFSHLADDFHPNKFTMNSDTYSVARESLEHLAQGCLQVGILEQGSNF